MKWILLIALSTTIVFVSFLDLEKKKINEKMDIETKESVINLSKDNVKENIKIEKTQSKIIERKSDNVKENYVLNRLEFYHIINHLNKKLETSYNMIKRFNKIEDIDNFIELKKTILNKNNGYLSFLPNEKSLGNYSLVNNMFNNPFIYPLSSYSACNKDLISYDFNIKINNLKSSNCTSRDNDYYREKLEYKKIYPKKEEIEALLLNQDLKYMISDYYSTLKEIINNKNNKLEVDLLLKNSYAEALEIINVLTYYVYDKNYLIYSSEYNEEYKSFIKNNTDYGQENEYIFNYRDKEVKNILLLIDNSENLIKIEKDINSYLEI
jgi:hypothetical protein